ncbi:copper resistance protein CopZ [Wenjunlia vitaminophila]|uniref:Copper resistance protein CopZ n=1 Tax=Wenjunlia vitaminophila TaxID=76728 RepID=A0A0T6LQ28_WENVI|nr:copper resistance protein CopZ [Wenjunlia vitaminophila]
MSALSALSALAALAALAGCSSASGATERPELRVDHPYIPRPASAEMAAGYFTVSNTGGRDDRLVEVVSDLTDDVSLHETAGGTMREVEGFDIPADGTLRLGRGGGHVMLMGLQGRPRIGQKVTFELRFETSEPITVEVPVTAMTYRPPSEEKTEKPTG